MKVKEQAKLKKTVDAIPSDCEGALVAYIDPRKKKVIMVPFGTDEGLQEIFSHIYEFVDEVINGGKSTEEGGQE